MLDCCSTTASEASHLLGVSLAKAHSHLILRSQHVTHKPRDIFLYLMSCRILDLHAIVHCSTKDDKNCGHKSSKPRLHNSHNLKYMGNCIYIYMTGPPLRVLCCQVACMQLLLLARGHASTLGKSCSLQSLA